jgi:hypothetical protein
MRNSNDTIGNRTRDLPACGVVPQPTELPHAPGLSKYRTKMCNSAVIGKLFVSHAGVDVLCFVQKHLRVCDVGHMKQEPLFATASGKLRVAYGHVIM